MCNSWNHPPDCRCGFGGEGHTGKPSGGWQIAWEQNLPTRPWHNHADDFCRPSKCPICDSDVFFVRHNGGSVWFDELGKPWPKHGCFADDNLSNSANTSLISAEEVKAASIVVRELLKAGNSYTDIAHTPEAQLMRKYAYQVGVIEGMASLAKIKSIEVVKPVSAHKAVEFAANFDAAVEAARVAEEGQGRTTPKVVTLAHDGSINVLPMRSDKDASTKLKRLHASSNLGNRAECGLAFAAIYSDGWAQVCRIIEPVAAPAEGEKKAE